MKKQGKFVYGATKSSVPCVQNGRISFRKYSALFIVNPFGSTTAGNLNDTSRGSRFLKMDIFTGSSSKLIKHDTSFLRRFYDVRPVCLVQFVLVVIIFNVRSKKALIALLTHPAQVSHGF